MIKYLKDIVHLITQERVKIIGILILQIAIAIFILPISEFSDSADNLLGGCLILNGKHIYTDFFSHHAPFMYYVAAGIHKLYGECSLLIPRYFFYILFSGSIWLLFFYTRLLRLPFVVLISYALLSIFYSTHLILAETWLINIVICTFLLLFFHEKMSKKIFFLLFLIAQFSFIVASPVYVFTNVLLMLYFFLTSSYNKYLLVVFSFIPALGFLILVGINSFWSNVFIFNYNYYAPYSMGILKEHLMYGISQVDNLIKILDVTTLGRYTERFALLFEGILIIAWLFVQKHVWNTSSKKIIVVFNILIGVSLFVRTGGHHLLPLIFFFLIEILYFLPRRKWSFPILGILLLLGIRIFIGPFFFWLNDKNVRFQSLQKVVTEHTNKDDSMLIYPLRPELYVASNRNPGSYYYFYLPWVADMPGTQAQIISDIKNNRVKIVIMESDWKIGNESIRSYMRGVSEFMNGSDEYQKISDENSSTDIFVLK